MDLILNRRSIRNYNKITIDKDKIEKLLRAAMQAPSAANQQPWEFIVVDDKDVLKELAGTSPYAGTVANSAVTFVLLLRKDRLIFPDFSLQDMAAATENLLLEAVDLELGAVWVGVAPVEERMNYIRNMFNLPENIDPFALIPVGYPEGQKNEFIDRFDQTRVHYNSW